MIITTTDGMVNIDADNMVYGNVRHMYTSGDGAGLQIDEGMDSVAIKKLCNAVSDSIYALQDALDVSHE